MRRDAILQIHNDKENFAHVINRNQTMSTRDLIEITQKFKKESAQAIAETAPATRQAEVVENPNTAPNDDQKIDKIASDLENLLQMIAKNKLSKENAPSTAANTKKPLNSAKSVPKPTSAVPSGSSGPLLPKQPQLQRKGSTASTSSSHASGPPTKQTKAPTAVPPRPANPPNAYNYVAIYKAKNTRAEERRREQEREARAFRPRPLPDFKRSHRLMESKLSELKKMPVLPQTPPTLKRSIEAAARRQAIVSHLVSIAYICTMFLNEYSSVDSKRRNCAPASRPTLSRDPLTFSSVVRTNHRWNRAKSWPSPSIYIPRSVRRIAKRTMMHMPRHKSSS